MTPPLPLDEWERHAHYICRDKALTNAKNQALRVLLLIEQVRHLEATPHASDERHPSKNAGEDRLAAALAPFGWTCGPEFWQRYYSDAWVFNLANAVQALSEHLELVLANDCGCGKGDDCQDDDYLRGAPDA